jgi:hypothetical protein
MTLYRDIQMFSDKWPPTNFGGQIQEDLEKLQEEEYTM